MEIREIKDKNTWENFLFDCPEKTFLQSWNWAEFQKQVGNKIWRLGVFENNELIAVSFFYKIKARRGTFLFIPHAPAITLAKEHELGIKLEILKTLLKELKKLAKAEKASFIRIAPIWGRTEQNAKIFKELGFRNAPIHMHPELTWQLGLSLSKDRLLMQMRKTTRYLIRQALKNSDIEIVQGRDLKGIEEFNKLYRETIKRHHFTPFSLNYLKNEFSAFAPDNQILVFLGKHKNQALCSSVVIYWQDMAFYHQGASLPSKIPVSYLMQWEAIKQAKARGCKIYNFWGIMEEWAEIGGKTHSRKAKKHPWRGLTLFKTGFSGYPVAYTKTQDFILSYKYWFNFAVEKMRKIKRHL